VFDPELVETFLPSFELAPVGTAEADMVEPGAELVEQLAPVGGAVRVQRQEDTAGRREDDVVESSVVTIKGGNWLVEDGLHTQQAPVPRAAGLQVGHGQGDVVRGRELGHGGLLWVVPVPDQRAAYSARS
jgi:hypothetical protein